jgi:hypothetical protein
LTGRDRVAEKSISKEEVRKDKLKNKGQMKLEKFRKKETRRTRHRARLNNVRTGARRIKRGFKNIGRGMKKRGSVKMFGFFNNKREQRMIKEEMEYKRRINEMLGGNK